MSNETVKISANLSRVVVDALRDVAQKRGVSMTEALRQAISHEKYFVEATQEKKRVLLEDTTNGKIREVLFG
jgi:hypothetical protein